MSAIVPTRQNTCAIIVTYYPDEGFPIRLEHVLAQFPKVIVVDNGSQGAAADLLHTESLLPNVLVHKNQTNLGIATALNQGVGLARQCGFNWIVTLDQDTLIFPEMFATLLDVYGKSEGGNVLIGGNYWDAHKKRNFIQCKKNTHKPFVERKTLITSGTLIPLSLFKAIGFFREDYFIDSVDHEFCLRARKHGFRILISCLPVMSQSIGAHIEHAGRLRRFLSFNHSPVRKYFIARNTVATVKKYMLQEPTWSLKQVWRLLSDFASILIFESEKMEKTTAFMVGIVHGVTGEMGPIEKTWPHDSR